ncbi:MAG: hypothetical protein C5B57_09540 [Blastocatellia bacterium]|nr:MAG: hypothetical protein C5B57_09540 [Blastocatellia bacterium]
MIGGMKRVVMRSCWALMLVGAAVLGRPVLAHHSFAVYYIEQDTIEVEGDVVEFDYKNPHSWIHIMSRDVFGKPKLYAVEWASTSRLESDGITKRTLRTGDLVRIWAAPSRAPNDNRIRLKRIERRSDGWKWGQNPSENR